MITKGAIHDSSISLHSYRPTTYFLATRWRCGTSCPSALSDGEKSDGKNPRGDGNCAHGQKENVCIYSFNPHLWRDDSCGRVYPAHGKGAEMIEEAGGRDLGGREIPRSCRRPPAAAAPAADAEFLIRRRFSFCRILLQWTDEYFCAWKAQDFIDFFSDFPYTAPRKRGYSTFLHKIKRLADSGAQFPLMTDHIVCRTVTMGVFMRENSAFPRRNQTGHFPRGVIWEDIIL